MERIASGVVESLCINGEPVERVEFDLAGPIGDVHYGFSRRLSGHDGSYISTSALVRGDEAFNWRMWTGISVEEISEVEEELGLSIPQGCLLENITFRGISDFSRLDPATRLVFPRRADSQTILAVWEWNGPCRIVGQRLAEHYDAPELKKRFIAAAQGKRGVMGIVLSVGVVEVGDEVSLYPRVY